MPWKDSVHLHFTAEGTRADLDHVLSGYRDGWHVYTCGPDRYMQGGTEALEGAPSPTAQTFPVISTRKLVYSYSIS